jgi:molybdopterin-guanine dinucleotide biosynthesis protein
VASQKKAQAVQAIIEFVGETGAGKTALAMALGDELSASGVLYIDASPDLALTNLLAVTPPRTLAEALSQISSDNREAVDWAFHDLTVPIGGEGELLTVGALPHTLGADSEALLRYGLPRLVQAYAYVVVDGFHPVLHRILPEAVLQPVIVLTPEQAQTWQMPEEATETPAVILNRHGNEALPEPLEEAISRGQVRLIGKLPLYATDEECARNLPEDFKNCLLRLNIPFYFQAS